MAKFNWRHLVLFLSFLSLSLAASSNSFCKCTCFTNSSLIPLTPPKKEPTVVDGDKKSAVGRTCNDCNKEFCKSYGLAICADATDDDMLTTCFQRDSTKDEAVIYIFIIATVGLLAWAGMKPYIGKLRDRALRGNYAPMGAEARPEGR